MTTEKLERPGRATPGVCVNHGAIKDAPENGNVGYGALFPKRDAEGNPIMRQEQGDRGTVLKEVTPANRRTLCRVCFKAEWEERYPGGLDKYGDPVNDPFPNG